MALVPFGSGGKASKRGPTVSGRMPNKHRTGEQKTKASASGSNPMPVNMSSKSHHFDVVSQSGERAPSGSDKARHEQT